MSGESSVCTRKSALMASGDYSQGPCCPLPSALLSFEHLQTFFMLVLFLDCALPLCHFPRLRGFTLRSFSLVLSHSPGHLFPPVFVSSSVLLGVSDHGSFCVLNHATLSQLLSAACCIQQGTSTSLMLPPVFRYTLEET